MPHKDLDKLIRQLRQGVLSRDEFIDKAEMTEEEALRRLGKD